MPALPPQGLEVRLELIRYTFWPLYHVGPPLLEVLNRLPEEKAAALRALLA